MKKEKVNDKSQNRYIAGIDGLRAIAVLMVFAYHLKLPIAKGGIIGVTIFFVISGFSDYPYFIDGIREYRCS